MKVNIMNRRPRYELEEAHLVSAVWFGEEMDPSSSKDSLELARELGLQCKGLLEIHFRTFLQDRFKERPYQHQSQNFDSGFLCNLHFLGCQHGQVYCFPKSDQICTASVIDLRGRMSMGQKILGGPICICFVARVFVRHNYGKYATYCVQCHIANIRPSFVVYLHPHSLLPVSHTIYSIHTCQV